MPRSPTVYTLPAGTTVAPNTTIESSWANALTSDIAQTFNTVQPIVYGGTGAATAGAAADALSPDFASVASSATTNIGAATSPNVNITGTTTITAFDNVTAGIKRFVKFAGALTLTHNATSLILPGGANITTAAGDTAIFVSEGSGNWRCLAYQYASGFTLTSADAGAVAGPALDLYRDSASPAAADNIGTIRFYGEDSAGNKDQYAEIVANITDPTSTSEDGKIRFFVVKAGANTEVANFIGDGLAVVDGSASAPSLTNIGDENTGFFFPAADEIGVAIGGTERARWSGTEFIVGATSTSGIANGASVNVGTYLGDGVIAAQRNDGPSINLSRASSTGAVQEFFVNNSSVGSISVTGSATAYNTSSDYRLSWKIGATPLIDAGAFIDALKPYHFPEVGHAGFIAHEFAEVSPISVTGEKDAIDEDGKPIYQAMQASTADVIAHLVAEIQSLRKRVAAIEGNA